MSSPIREYFTEKLYSHQYFIGRKEAKEELGLKTVVYADDELSKLMTDLYGEYAKEMELDKLWNPELELGANNNVNKKDFKIAFVESAGATNHFNISMEFRRQSSQEQVGFRVLEQGWR